MSRRRYLKSKVKRKKNHKAYLEELKEDRDLAYKLADITIEEIANTKWYVKLYFYFFDPADYYG